MLLFKTFKKSLYCFDEYMDLIKLNNFKTFLYTIILSLILSLNFIFPIFITYLKFDFKTNMQKYIPDFKIENGTLTLNDEINISNDLTKIVLDTKNNYSLSDFDNFNNVILLTSDTLYIKSQMINEHISIDALSKMLNIYTKDDLIKSSFLNSIIYQTIFFITFLIFVFSYIILIFIILTSSIFKKMYFYSKKSFSLSFKEVFKLTTLAQTLPVLSTSIFTILGLNTNPIIYIGMFITVSFFVSENIKKYNK